MNPMQCPICAKRMTGQGPKEWPDWPFCSPRCKLVDLGRWLDGKYSVPVQAKDADDDFKDSSKPPDPLAASREDEV